MIIYRIKTRKHSVWEGDYCRALTLFNEFSLQYHYAELRKCYMFKTKPSYELCIKYYYGKLR